MIGRQHRFHGYHSLQFVYRHGKTVRTSNLSLRFVQQGKRSHYRAAVVVSKKIHKSAVQRNRFRRRVYELIRESLPREAKPYDLVFTVLQETALQASSNELDEQVGYLLKKAGLVVATPAKPKAHGRIEQREK